MTRESLFFFLLGPGTWLNSYIANAGIPPRLTEQIHLLEIKEHSSPSNFITPSWYVSYGGIINWYGFPPPSWARSFPTGADTVSPVNWCQTMTWAHTPFHSPHTLVLWLNRAHCPLPVSVSWVISQADHTSVGTRLPAGALKRSHRFQFPGCWNSPQDSRVLIKGQLTELKVVKVLWPGSGLSWSWYLTRDTQTASGGSSALGRLWPRQVTAAFGRGESALQDVTPEALRRGVPPPLAHAAPDHSRQGHSPSWGRSLIYIRTHTESLLLYAHWNRWRLFC